MKLYSWVSVIIIGCFLQLGLNLAVGFEVANFKIQIVNNGSKFSYLKPKIVIINKKCMSGLDKLKDILIPQGDSYSSDLQLHNAPLFECYWTHGRFKLNFYNYKDKYLGYFDFNLHANREGKYIDKSKVGSNNNVISLGVQGSMNKGNRVYTISVK